jgi:hypothetical protein
MSTQPTSLTLAQLQQLQTATIMALGSGVLRAEFGGRKVEYRSVADAKQALEVLSDLILTASGRTETRVGLAQHKRGDGPTGPGPFYWENW